jgi:hypothetical protein
MTQETSRPPPFIIDATYEDERGQYMILSVEGARMTFERRGSTTQQHTDDIPLKARIHNRIVPFAGRLSPNPIEL